GADVYYIAADAEAHESDNHAHTNDGKQGETHGKGANGGDHAHHGVPDNMMPKFSYYLNIPFFSIRLIFYFIIWGGLAWYIVKVSRDQDVSGEPQLTRKLEMLSAPATLVFALSITFAAFDLMMSLDWTWYSTMFGVYYFTGSMVGAISTIILVCMTLQRFGFLKPINKEHYHDLGKLLFAFVFFWGYIAFSQYMLIWYASIPAELMWMARRGASTFEDHSTPYIGVALLLLFGHFVIPFLGLLSRHVKRNRAGLAFWAVWMLVMHLIDLYWVVMPEFDSQAIFPNVIAAGIDLFCIAGLIILFVGAAARVLGSMTLMPVRDPRLGESLAFHNI
ncbi:MAG: hypothetical protein MI741_17215, partial [Rhodospirillales bacterium]|nr:hypothetical protein [Rhodospirillales bacterium]